MVAVPLGVMFARFMRMMALGMTAHAAGLRLGCSPRPGAHQHHTSD